MADIVPDIQGKIKGIVAKQLNIEQDSIEPAKLLVDLGADELDVIEIVMRLEEQFGVVISDEETHQLVSIKAIGTYLNNKK